MITFRLPKGFYSPAKERRENENALLDKDGYPPCVMTVAEFKAHIDETFGHRDHRIIAFKVRSYCPGGTLTTRRGEMPAMRANKVQVAACKKALHRRK